MGSQENDLGPQGADFQRKLFEVPDNCEFPLEISCHLKAKFHSVLEQNWHLKRHLDYLDKEVIDLRKYRAEHRDKCGRTQETEFTNSSTTIMTQRIVELSKKNRDLNAQTEGMKTKIAKLIRENESLRNMVECFRDKDIQDDVYRTNAESDILSSTTTPGSQQNAQLTNKVIEYRRQNQLLRMELKTALRALSQEVGDGATPHGVLNMVSGTGVPSWRGRQQQILALQQKVSELQAKLKEAIIGDHDVQTTNGAGDADLSISDHKVSVSSQRNGLIQQDKKKQEQIEKLTQDLEQTTSEWKSCQKELKASKARIQTLESQIKTFKSHVEILEGKLTETEKASEGLEKEMKQIRQETANLKERERRYRDQTSIEIQEGQRALQRERAIVLRLQNVIQEKQDAIQRQDGEIIELRNKLEISCSGTFGGNVDAVDRIRQIEAQLENATKVIEAGEREKKSLLKMMQDYLSQTEEERQKYIQASGHTARISCVLQRADQCINECLDAGQVTNEDILHEVEHIRTLIRELKLGDLYVYENVQHKDMTKKLKTQVEMLKREVSSLKCALKEISNARRKDLQNFATLTEQLKSEWTDAIKVKQVSSVFSR